MLADGPFLHGTDGLVPSTPASDRLRGDFGQLDCAARVRPIPHGDRNSAASSKASAGDSIDSMEPLRSSIRSRDVATLEQITEEERSGEDERIVEEEAVAAAREGVGVALAQTVGDGGKLPATSDEESLLDGPRPIRLASERLSELVSSLLNTDPTAKPDDSDADRQPHRSLPILNLGHARSDDTLRSAEPERCVAGPETGFARWYKQSVARAQNTEPLKTADGSPPPSKLQAALSQGDPNAGVVCLDVQYDAKTSPSPTSSEWPFGLTDGDGQGSRDRFKAREGSHSESSDGTDEDWPTDRKAFCHPRRAPHPPSPPRWHKVEDGSRAPSPADVPRRHERTASEAARPASAKAAASRTRKTSGVNREGSLRLLDRVGAKLKLKRLSTESSEERDLFRGCSPTKVGKIPSPLPMGCEGASEVLIKPTKAKEGDAGPGLPSVFDHQQQQQQQQQHRRRRLRLGVGEMPR
ncbi:uncharacterized protein PSFLO_02891 [Pseudozyma flocculosa]|uniref:Uncharacterized protein n=1 Tax=Pseudozyma flocculosa TaxID=84751 RepID=A0A5C3EYX9_9BASI|nr:uncharacterized protein PSFLO_02891 [Pseudozyma flocculosa]